jgi:hypothetical protein
MNRGTLGIDMKTILIHTCTQKNQVEKPNIGKCDLKSRKLYCMGLTADLKEQNRGQRI